MHVPPGSHTDFGHFPSTTGRPRARRSHDGRKVVPRTDANGTLASALEFATVPTMKMPPRSRLLPLLSIGVAMLAVTALWLRQQQGAFRGASYYFPAWRTSDGSDSRAHERLEELTNINTGLPMVFAALEHTPSAAGAQWNQLYEKLPGSLRERLPTYEPNDDLPLAWLSFHAENPEVARAVTNRWRRWPEELRVKWLFSQTPGVFTNRAEYLPLLMETSRSTNSIHALNAANLLATVRPVSEMNAALIARAMTSSGEAPQAWFGAVDYQLAATLAALDPAPPVIRRALQQWLDSTSRPRAAAAALALARLAPDEFPPAIHLEPRWRQLPGDEGIRLFRWLGQPQFQPLAASPWGIGFLTQLLQATPGTNRPRTITEMSPALGILPVLTKLGPAAAEAVPGILPLLAHTNSQMAAAAATAFASVAPPWPGLVPAILPHLTNEAAAAPLLLWLTSLGTNAVAASGEVYGLARETTRFPDVSWPGASQMDSALAQRYGLMPSTSLHRPTTEAERARANWLKPSKIKLSALGHCPPALVRFWPGYERTHASVTNQAPSVSEEVQTRRLLRKLPLSNLAELAQRCLASIAAGNPAWQLPPDSPTQ